MELSVSETPMSERCCCQVRAGWEAVGGSSERLVDALGGAEFCRPCQGMSFLGNLNAGIGGVFCPAGLVADKDPMSNTFPERAGNDVLKLLSNVALA